MFILAKVFAFASLLCVSTSAAACGSITGSCEQEDDATSLMQVQKTVHRGVDRLEGNGVISTQNSTAGNSTELQAAEEQGSKTVQAAQKVVAEKESDEKLAESKE